MSRAHFWRLVPLVGLPLLAVGCAQSDLQMGTQNLNDRLQTRLASDMKDGGVAVEALPDGTRVTIPDNALFGPSGVALSDSGRGVLTGVMQAMLNPSWQSIAIADSPASPAVLQGPRTRAVTQFFTEHGLGGMLGGPVPEVTPPLATAPAETGLSITISVVPPGAVPPAES